jgi:hypothetical protein
VKESGIHTGVSRRLRVKLVFREFSEAMMGGQVYGDNKKGGACR